nr:hypothetical protein 4 [Gammaproteobacteria bacterium]
MHTTQEINELERIFRKISDHSDDPIVASALTTGMNELQEHVKNRQEWSQRGGNAQKRPEAINAAIMQAWDELTLEKGRPPRTKEVARRLERDYSGKDFMDPVYWADNKLYAKDRNRPISRNSLDSVICKMGLRKATHQ